MNDSQAMISRRQFHEWVRENAGDDSCDIGAEGTSGMNRRMG